MGLYVDGSSDKSVVSNNLQSHTIVNAGKFEMAAVGGGLGPLNGYLDDIRVYDRVLTSDEVDDIANLNL